MPTLPIDYVVTYYGNSAWKDLVIRWNGTGNQWNLYQLGIEEPIYTGPEQQFQFSGSPSTQYNFKVTTKVDGKDYDYTVLTYTTSLPAPLNLRASYVDPSKATLQWEATPGVDYYQICDVKDSYKVIGQTATAFELTYSLTNLTQTSLYSYAVRSVFKEQRSRWSNSVTFFTPAAKHIDPGVYRFTPQSVYTWRAGLPGSTNPSWAPSQSDWAHGDGLSWGDLNGVQTTYFFFGSGNPFNRLLGANVTKCEIYLSRGSFGGDPGPVLSRVGLHTYADKPDGEPKPSGSSVDVGTLSRGEGKWVEVPTSWAEQLITGAYASGWYWGNCLERYQVSKNVDSSYDPRIGIIKITVG